MVAPALGFVYGSEDRRTPGCESPALITDNRLDSDLFPHGIIVVGRNEGIEGIKVLGAGFVS
jgi:hypothetical protein